LVGKANEGTGNGPPTSTCSSKVLHLFYETRHRGVGAGKALLKHLAKIALAKNCGRFEWNVLDWNEPAIQFYKSIGAKPQDEWVGYRLAGKALEEFACS